MGLTVTALVRIIQLRPGATCQTSVSLSQSGCYHSDLMGEMERLAGSVGGVEERVTPDLGVISSSPTLGIEIS